MFPSNNKDLSPGNNSSDRKLVSCSFVATFFRGQRIQGGIHKRRLLLGEGGSSPVGRPHVDASFSRNKSFFAPRDYSKFHLHITIGIINKYMYVHFQVFLLIFKCQIRKK